MRKKLSVVLVLVLALTVIAVAPASAKKPIGGDMELEFNLGFGAGPYPAISWVGTVGLEGELYGIAFFPTDAKDVGTAHHFWEGWKVYEYDTGDPFFAFTDGVLTTFNPGIPVLEGSDRGVTNHNDKYRMRGTVDGATEPFEEWIGRRVHMAGVIEWYEFGAPQYAPGSFRIN
ncbi:MAG: hypothetical protein ABFR89_07865 [Actinomycetota bacterium]